MDLEKACVRMPWEVAPGASPPEDPRRNPKAKIMRYMPQYTPEDQVTNLIASKTLERRVSVCLWMLRRPPEAKKMQYMREYTPEYQVTN